MQGRAGQGGPERRRGSSRVGREAALTARPSPGTPVLHREQPGLMGPLCHPAMLQNTTFGEMERGLCCVGVPGFGVRGGWGMWDERRRSSPSEVGRAGEGT